MSSAKTILFCLTLVLFLYIPAYLGKSAGYFEYKYALQRDLLQEKEREQARASIHLNDDEVIVNSYLEYLKWQEFQRTRDNFLPSHPIEKVLSDIKSSKVYQVLKKLPKGGNMHLHHNHVVSKSKILDKIMSSALYDNLYVKARGSGQWNVDFFVNPPDNDWVRVKDNTTSFSKSVLVTKSTFLGVMDKLASSNPTDSSLRWKEMGPLFSRIGSHIVNNANMSAWHTEAMFQAAMDENVQYLETKTSPGGKLYVLDSDPAYSATQGKHYIDNADGELELNITQSTLKDFMSRHPEFIGYKRIMNGYRRSTKDRIKEDMLKTVRLWRKYPTIVGGFDMVGEEDRGYSLLFYVDDFAYLEANNEQVPSFLHTSETSWPDDLVPSLYADDPVATLQNVYEAIIFGAKRVGHGLGFVKHPYLMKVLKERNVAIEANPVSNMMLGYVPDQRNHPATTYLPYGVPVVLGSDDPATFGYDEFTVDWYEAFMGWGLNLADMKQLANNSLQYSAMSSAEKAVAMTKWTAAWNIYIAMMKNETCQSQIHHKPPVLTEIYPKEGHISDETKVRVFGRNFGNSLCKKIICKFGAHMTNGRYVYESMITCNAPGRKGFLVGTLQPETVPFSLSLDGGTSYLTANVSYMYAHQLSKQDHSVTDGIVFGVRK